MEAAARLVYPVTFQTINDYFQDRANNQTVAEFSSGCSVLWKTQPAQVPQDGRCRFRVE